MLRSSRWLPVALVVLAAAPAREAPAFSLLDRAFGTPAAGPSARQRALGGGGAMLDPGAWALGGNPAALALATSSRVQLSGALVRASENRFVPLFDTFDSFVDEAAIAVNDHGYGQIAGGAVVSRPELAGVRVGVLTYERLDPRYDYFDERRTTATTDEIVAERFRSTAGALRVTSLGAAMPLPGDLYAGAALNLWDGRITDREALVGHVSTVTAWTNRSQRTLSGTSVAIGAAVQAGSRLAAGLAWESGAKLDDRFEEYADDSLLSPAGASRTQRVPPRVLFAGTYRPRNALRSTFTLDAEWTSWSGVRDAQDPAAAFEDTWDVRFGVEHTYLAGLPARVGFRYERAAGLAEADRAWFTFGAGWVADRVRLDAAVEVGKRESRQAPVWVRAEQGPAVGTGLDRVEDTLVRVTLGAEVSWP